MNKHEEEFGDNEMKPFIEVGGRKIGENLKPLVIAEIGINHGGCIEVAKKMVDAAADAGAEVIKHQTHIVEDEMSIAAKTVIPDNADVSIYEIMKRCALNEEEEIELKEYVESKDIIFLSTPFSRAAADRLKRMGVVAYKIGSGELNNYPLVDHIASFRKPMIVSTGMNSIESIKKTVDILNRKKIPFALLHTTNIYPTPPNLVRLGAYQELKSAFPGIVTGLSDHTINNNACLAATALGASILERHFTDRKDRNGPDIRCSMDGKELKQLIEASAEIALMRGGKKEAVAEERPTIDFAFATVVTIKTIKRGDVFSEDNIWVKRPGIGEIRAEFYNNIIGKTSKKNLAEDKHLKWDDIL